MTREEAIEQQDRLSRYNIISSKIKDYDAEISQLKNAKENPKMIRVFYERSNKTQNDISINVQNDPHFKGYLQGVINQLESEKYKLQQEEQAL